jgi:hypothetical protein
VATVWDVRTDVSAGVDVQFVSSSARNRIKVRVQRVIVCASWLSLIP